MRILTIQQPWAELIITGRKTIELRSWSTKYRGPILVLAGKAYDTSGPADVDGARGAIVGLVHLHEVRLAIADDARFALCAPAEGRFAWCLLGSRRRAEPIPWRGTLGLVRAPEALLSKLGL